MSELRTTAQRNKRTVDVGLATIVAAIITAVGAITTAVLATVLPHVTASSPAPVPTVTVTKYASAAVTTTPAPVVTVTAHPATTSFGHGTSGWVWVAGGLTLLVALVTLVGVARPAVQVVSMTSAQTASKPAGDEP